MVSYIVTADRILVAGAVTEGRKAAIWKSAVDGWVKRRDGAETSKAANSGRTPGKCHTHLGL